MRLHRTFCSYVCGRYHYLFKQLDRTSVPFSIGTWASSTLWSYLLFGKISPQDSKTRFFGTHDHTWRELCRFLVICGWLRLFITQFTMVAITLATLLSEKRPWQWGVDQKGSIQCPKASFFGTTAVKQTGSYSSLYITDWCEFAWYGLLFVSGERAGSS